MQCSFLIWLFIYHPTMSINFNNLSPVLLLYNDSPGVCLDKEEPYIAQFPPGIINWKHRFISEQKIKEDQISAPRGRPDKECSCFDFPAHLMFTLDKFWSSLGTSIFENSSSAANDAWYILPSRLPICFLWLFLNVFMHSFLFSFLTLFNSN